jgi:hypothetical protein
MTDTYPLPPVAAPEIASLIAGPELDRLVAEQVMGWRIHGRNTVFYVPAEDQGRLMQPGRCWATDTWRPSRDIAKAWMIVERITDPRLPRVADFLPSTRFMAEWRRLDLWAYSAQEAAHAICLAALRSITPPTAARA